MFVQRHSAYSHSSFYPQHCGVDTITGGPDFERHAVYYALKPWDAFELSFEGAYITWGMC
jgi:hypothetical protein